MPAMLKPWLLILATFALRVAANAEKIIFQGPAPDTIPLTKPTLSDLHLDTLTPDTSSLRTNLSRVFPSDVNDKPKGESTWLLLDNLTKGQRYELRVCWAAIEPTAFSMDVYPLDTVWSTPELMVSLANYAYARMPEPDLENPESKSPGGPGSSQQAERTASVLLLHVQAAADYYADNTALMENPPPVLVDLILDPYILNVLPRSLLPTAGYIVVVAIVAWFVAQRIAAMLQMVADEPAVTDTRKKK